MIDVTVVKGVRPRSEIECKHHTRDALCLHSSCTLSAGRATENCLHAGYPRPPLQSNVFPAYSIPPPPPVFFFFSAAYGANLGRALKAPVVMKLSAHTYPTPYTTATP